MTRIHISELIFNVTATSKPFDGGDLEAPLPASESLPPLESMIAQGSTLPATPWHSADLSAIDPRVLADRVYRLMRDELELARERE